MNSSCAPSQDFFSKLLKFVAKKTAVAFAQTYGLGIVGGVVGVMLLKRGIKAVPIAGAVVAPFLGGSGCTACLLASLALLVATADGDGGPAWRDPLNALYV